MCAGQPSQPQATPRICPSPKFFFLLFLEGGELLSADCRICGKTHISACEEIVNRCWRHKRLTQTLKVAVQLSEGSTEVKMCFNCTHP